MYVFPVKIYYIEWQKLNFYLLLISCTILTYKVDPLTEIIKIFLMVVDP